MKIVTRALSLAAALAAAASASPHAPWTALLREHVKDGVVDYAGFQADEASLDAYLQVLAATDPAALGRDRKLAFWINAYNAFTVKLILKRYPDIRSIKDYWSPWAGEDWVVGGKPVSLDTIEHKVLRSMGEPRIHVAIVCASVSCPDLASEAYEAETLDAQLTAAMERFLANPTKGMKVGREKGLLYGWSDVVRLSKILSWFGDDFGPDQASRLRFLEPYMSEEQRSFVTEHAATLKVDYFGYDWSLNGK